MLVFCRYDISEWVRDCCEQFFSNIMAETNQVSMKYWCPLCTRPTHLVGFLYMAYWNNSPLINIYLHSDTFSRLRANQSFSSYSSMLCPYGRSSKYQFFSRWFDLNPRSCLLAAIMLTITPPMQFILWLKVPVNLYTYNTWYYS